MDTLPAASVSRPVTEPAPLSLHLLTEESFFDELLPMVRHATSVVASTFLYDEPSLHSMLLARLGGPNPFDLNLFLDNQGSASGSCRNMKTRLRELVRSGASMAVQWTFP